MQNIMEFERFEYRRVCRLICDNCMNCNQQSISYRCNLDHKPQQGTVRP